jgi:MFS family permease
VAVTVAGGLLAVMSTFFSGTPHFVLLCVAAMATGAGSNIGMLVIQRTAGVATRDSTERVRIFSWLGVAPSFANVIGPVAVGFMIDGLGFGAAYGMILLMPLATLVSARHVPHLPGSRPAAASGRQARLGPARCPQLQALVVRQLVAVHVLGRAHLCRAGPGTRTRLQRQHHRPHLGSFTLSVTLVRMAIPHIAHRLHETTVLRCAMVGSGLVFVLYPLAPNPLLMGLCSVLLGVTLGSVQPMVMAMLHHLTPDNRHGEALAFRSMAINTSSTVLPLIFGATGAVVGAAVLFWVVGGAVGAGSWLARRLAAA